MATAVKKFYFLAYLFVNFILISASTWKHVNHEYIGSSHSFHLGLVHTFKALNCLCGREAYFLNILWKARSLKGVLCGKQKM